MPPTTVPGRSMTARSLAGSRNATIKPARAVRIDLGADPLAPVAPWGVDTELTPAARSIADQQLGELVDQAQAQVIVLRSTLEEAAASDRVVRQHVSELVQRIQQGRQFAAEIDKRIQSAGVAAGVLEKAAAALRALEQVVDQIRASHAKMEEQTRTRLAQQGEALNLQLSQQGEAFARRLAELEERMERRVLEMEAKYAEVIGKAEHAATTTREQAGAAIDAARREVEGKVDQLVANIDRHAAQAQARVSLILDGASDRLAVMEQQARALGGRSFDQLETLCRQAVDVLGYDPRTAGIKPEPVVGSLGHAVRAANEVIEEANQAGLRIGAMQNGARAMIEELRALEAQAAATAERAEPMRVELQARIDALLARAGEASVQLERALEEQRVAAGRCEETSAVLARQREDLSAIAAASEHHVARAKDAAGTLSAKIDIAGAESARLEEAMGRLRAEAAGVVEMAKRVAGLVQVREG